MAFNLNQKGHGMRIKETKVYRFAELSDEAKETAIERMADINVDYEWWDGEYEDAAQIGLKITEFDLDRNRHCKGCFAEDAEDTANKIIAQHGASCTTHETATQYIKERAELVKKYSDGVNTNIVHEDNDFEFDAECDELDAEFLKSILEDYSIILQKQYEHLMSETAILETIEANDYEFTVDGHLS